MNTLSADWGRQIKAIRVGLGIPQEALCQRAGVSRASLSKLENGRLPAVQTDTIERLVRGLGATAKVAVGSDLPGQSPSRTEERMRQRLRQEDLRQRHLRLALNLCMKPRTANADIQRALDQVRLWKVRKSCSPQYIARWSEALAGTPKDVASAMTSFGEWENAMFQNTPWAFKWT